MDYTDLKLFFDHHPRLLVLTGAGISVASGIPTYRDHAGKWQRSEPIEHQEFITQQSKRQRYWTRSTLGWHYVDEALPNRAHFELTQLEQSGRVTLLVTQNIDRLHQRSGHQKVIDLHGRLDRVVCLSCKSYFERKALQFRLLDENPHLVDVIANIAADGDADAEDSLTSATKEPLCEKCQGVLMPDVVFFGGSVPKARVIAVNKALEDADALLIIGSSLMVYSGFRFCKSAYAMEKPIAVINQGITRADSIAQLKIEADCGDVLSWIRRHS